MAIYVVKLRSLIGIVPSGQEYADTAAELVKLRREAKLNGNFFVEPEVGWGWGVGHPVLLGVWSVVRK